MIGAGTGPWAQCETDQFVSADVEQGDDFGQVLATSGNRVIIGAPRDDDAGASSGAVYVFERQPSGWVQVQKLVALDAAAGANFGFDVDIDGDSIIVGAFGDMELGFDAGAAYVFDYDGTQWNQSAKLLASNSFVGDLFGIDVAIQGDRAFVGACQLTAFEIFGQGAGRAHVYERVAGNWSETAILVATDADDGDRFGVAVDSDGPGTRVVVGAQSDDEAAMDAGASYVFELVGDVWVQSQKLIASDAGAGHRDGTGVSLSGDRLLVGCYHHDALGFEAGAAYIWELVGGTWVQCARLLASDAADNARFGRRLKLEEDLAVIGAAFGSTSGGGGGYLFERRSGTWEEVATYTAGDIDAGDEFGQGVTLGEGRVLIGAPLNDVGGTAYEFMARAANSATYGCSNPAGSLTLLSGTPAVGEVCVLGVDNPLGTQSIGSIPFVAFALSPQVGYPCGVSIPGWGMSGPTGELLISVSGPNPVGPILVGPPWQGPGQPSRMNLILPTACRAWGITVYCQGIMLDPTGSPRFGLTSGLELVLGS